MSNRMMSHIPSNDISLLALKRGNPRQRVQPLSTVRPSWGKVIVLPQTQPLPTAANN